MNNIGKGILDDVIKGTKKRCLSEIYIAKSLKEIKKMKQATTKRITKALL